MKEDVVLLGPNSDHTHRHAPNHWSVRISNSPTGNTASKEICCAVHLQHLTPAIGKSLQVMSFDFEGLQESISENSLLCPDSVAGPGTPGMGAPVATVPGWGQHNPATMSKLPHAVLGALAGFA